MKRHRLGWMLGGVVLLALGGCDQLKERAGIPDPAKVEAEGKAIGSACRHAGWGLEDCFRLNQEASKPAMFAGWKEMNEYMLKNDMQAMEPTVSPEGTAPHASPKKKKKVIELEPIDQVDKAGEHGKEAGAEADKAAHAEKTAPDPDKKAAAH